MLSDDKYNLTDREGFALNCDFCKNKNADYRFGERGLLICKECLGDIRDKGE